MRAIKIRCAFFLYRGYFIGHQVLLPPWARCQTKKNFTKIKSYATTPGKFFLSDSCDLVVSDGGDHSRWWRHHATHNYVYANQDLHAGLRNSHHHHCTLGHTPGSPDLLCDRHRGHTPTRHDTGTESTMARPGRHPAVVQRPRLCWCMVKEGRTSGPIYCDRPCPCAPVRGGARAHRSTAPDPRGLPSRIRPYQTPAQHIVTAVMWLSQAP